MQTSPAGLRSLAGILSLKIVRRWAHGGRVPDLKTSGQQCTSAHTCCTSHGFTVDFRMYPAKVVVSEPLPKANAGYIICV